MSDNRQRCEWVGSGEKVDPLALAYHDEEWGVPSHDDAHLFEMLTLEGAQSGLSWMTILRKREGYRRAFAAFDAERVARFGARDVTRLLGDAGIVRHRGKIESTINNARRVLELRTEFGSLAAYAWGYVPAPGARPKRMTLAALRKLGSTPESVAMSKDLKRRGWSFVGPTTVYAFMQAMGLVNDHLDGCHVRALASGRGSGRPPDREVRRPSLARP